MKSLEQRFNNAKLRVASGLMGLVLGAALAALVEKIILPWQGIICLAGKELLLAIPVTRICEMVLASCLKSGAAFASVPSLASAASVIHFVSAIWAS